MKMLKVTEVDGDEVYFNPLAIEAFCCDEGVTQVITIQKSTNSEGLKLRFPIRGDIRDIAHNWGVAVNSS